MDNGNDAWLEYREVNGTLIMFCRWCESKKYTNELAKGTSNYRKQSIDRHLNHHEHKSEAEARRNQNIIRVDFSCNLDTHKIRVITQMQCIYFMAKKYLALSVYPDLYELIDFHRKNSEVMKLCSYRRMQNLKMIQETLEDPQLAILNIVNTRWLSMSNSVKNLHQILDSVIDALRYDAEFDKKNHLASNLLDELNCDFIISTKYLADLMFILTKLINVFQREYVSFADIKIHLDMSFSEAIVDSIKSRFPQSNLYYSFRIFDPKLLPIKESELGKYGDEDIKKLSDYYGIDKVDEEGNVMEKIVDSDDVKQEWEVAKYYIKQIRSQNAAGGWEYIFNTYPDFVNEFPNIAKLVKISLIIPLSNAQVERIGPRNIYVEPLSKLGNIILAGIIHKRNDLHDFFDLLYANSDLTLLCIFRGPERIFSQHKLTKTRLRNRMNIETLNKHLMILLNGPDDFRRFDWNKAYDYWAMKTRRSN
ncbi:hypothetical protein RhiirC2_847565 [Rhizophagus irregularis]|uniref:C17orf113 probable zinc finger domain-containing protein n=1 Tax=Rhizophagus irregularis TaxID=588596 RepID=A0A2N1NI50_9GLOM|nr:hypothetical protein RhiirC2_847565 [Rhizophagus irregularis]